MTDQVNTRGLALEFLLEVEKGALSHVALRGMLERYQYLDKQERAFLTRLCEGTLERRLELDAIINYLKGVLGAKVACFFYEKTETDVKGSFRGNDGYDVCALAQKFGGGGHVKAAGCTISAPIAKAKEMVLAEVEKML